MLFKTYFMFKVPPWTIGLLVLIVLITILLLLYVLFRKVFKKIIKKSDKISGLKSTVLGNNSMPLLIGQTLKEKVSIILPIIKKNQ